MKRRDLIKGLSLLPLGGSLLGNAIPLQSIAGTSKPAGKGRNLVKELGIRTFINAAGTYTTMSASLMHEEVMDAIDQSAKEFCMLNEVQDKVGEKIAQMVHAEAAMVTAGAFSALMMFFQRPSSILFLISSFLFSVINFNTSGSDSNRL